MNNLLNEKLNNYIEKLSSSASTPGGGNTVGVVNSLACGLMLMSLRIAVLKKTDVPEVYFNIERKLENIQQKSIELAQKDSKKFKEVMASWKAGGERLQKALLDSAGVSLEIARQSMELINIIDSVDMSRFINIITDVGISLEFAGACFQSGLMNYDINVKGLKEQDEGMTGERDDLLKDFNGRYYKLSEKVKGFI